MAEGNIHRPSDPKSSPPRMLPRAGNGARGEGSTGRLKGRENCLGSPSSPGCAEVPAVGGMFMSSHTPRPSQGAQPCPPACGGLASIHQLALQREQGLGRSHELPQHTNNLLVLFLRKPMKRWFCQWKSSTVTLEVLPGEAPPLLAPRRYLFTRDMTLTSPLSA